jgi:hypothetical protein
LSVIPYLSQGQGVPVDAFTGLPKKKAAPKPTFTQQQIQASLAANPNATFGPSPGVNYGFGTAATPQLPNMPDYARLINDDPMYQQLLGDLRAQGVQDASSRAAQTGRAFTLFGQVPDLNSLGGLNLEFLNQDITPSVRELAQKNTDAGLSIKARQDKSFKDTIRTIKNALAARGALRSGESTHRLQEAQLERDQADFDTRDQLGQLIAGIQAGYVEAQRARTREQSQAAFGAEERARQLYPGQAGGSGGYAPPPPAAPAPPSAPAPPQADFQQRSPNAPPPVYGFLNNGPLVADPVTPYGAAADFSSIAKFLASLGR